jgi:rhodanese-related sulfurtransferase
MRDFVQTDLTVEAVDVAQVQAWLDTREILLVDVRETYEFEAEHIAGAVLLPLSRIEPERFPVMPGQKVVVYCAIGKRSEAARKMLAKAGHAPVFNMIGGLNAWKDAGFEVEAEL